LLERLAAETDAFMKTAPNLVSEETLRQRAIVPGKQRFQAVIGVSGQGDRWRQRVIESEYAFAKIGDPAEMHELRKVVAVDGKPYTKSDKAMEELMKSVSATDDKARKKLLEEFEKHGLIGTVTDFGQLLLLFAKGSQEKFSYLFAGEALAGAEQCLVFTYQQLDGNGAMTVFDSTGRQQPRIKGEIWVTKKDYRLVRIRLASIRNEGKTAVREEATVEYVPTAHGVVAPVSVHHTQYRDASISAENTFRYQPFQKFGASTSVKFETETEVKK
jgi:hypothetical protein